MSTIIFAILSIILWYFIIGFFGASIVILFANTGESIWLNIALFLMCFGFGSALTYCWTLIQKKYKTAHQSTPNDVSSEKFIDEIKQLNAQIESLKNENATLTSKLQLTTKDDKKKENFEKDIETLKNEKENLLSELKELKNDILIETIQVEKYDNVSSQEIKNQLQLLQLSEEAIIKENKAINVLNNVANSKILENNKKQILRSFNIECKSIIDSLTFKNIDTCRSKIQKSYSTLNNMFKLQYVSISPNYFEIKLKELTLYYEYIINLENEREQQKAIKAQLIEEEKVRREIEKEKQRIEKEETQFKNEVSKLMKYMSSTENGIEKQLYIDKIKELEDKIKLLEKDKENVLHKEQNTRAGYVYIISNIGSFGENVYKIGMTRRLEPMDRIKELGDASVPFQFDVHALIFSEDAPSLENILHQTFKDNQINKLNPRKEFYNIDLGKIKEVVKENYNNTVNFTEYAEAYEYRESKKIAETLKL